MATRARATENGSEAPGDDYGLPGEPSWHEVDWREHIHTARIDGRRATYVDVGSGPPVVFVHGLSGCWQNWLENIPYFAQRHRVIAMDLPGFGSSQMPAERVSMKGYGRFIDGLLQHLGLDKVALIGNSMGGFVAAELTINFPTYVDKLVLVSAAGVHELPGRVTPKTMVRAVGLTRPLTAAAIKRAHFLAARPRGRRAMLGLVCRYPERLRPEMCLEMVAGANKPAFNDALHSSVTYDFRDRLGEVEAPTLIVWGRNDMVIPVACAHIYERELRNSRKVILEKTGHVAMIERAQTFNRMVDEFLANPQPVSRSGEATTA